MKVISLMILAAGLSSCATLNESMTLGAGMGAVAGGLATYVANAASGGPAPTRNLLLGAGIGTAVGLVTSYFTHREVEDSRAACVADQIDMKFGDPPPPPFVFPKKAPKKGGRR